MREGTSVKITCPFVGSWRWLGGARVAPALQGVTSSRGTGSSRMVAGSNTPKRGVGLPSLYSLKLSSLESSGGHQIRAGCSGVSSLSFSPSTPFSLLLGMSLPEPSCLTPPSKGLPAPPPVSKPVGYCWSRPHPHLQPQCGMWPLGKPVRPLRQRPSLIPTTGCGQQQGRVGEVGAGELDATGMVHWCMPCRPLLCLGMLQQWCPGQCWHGQSLQWGTQPPPPLPAAQTGWPLPHPASCSQVSCPLPPWHGSPSPK